MNDTFGWTGKILNIDLETRKIRPISLPRRTYIKYMGGKGLGGYFLKPHATLDWNDPKMVVSLFTGPLTGTIAPTSGRLHLVSKSPLTGLVADASMGGKMAVQLKRAGWDGLVITGKSPSPVGIRIHNDQVSLLAANDLWGMDTREVHRHLRPQKAALAAIGPAGENKVRFASITADLHHSAGRCGIGAIWGDKGLKFIQVSGTGKTRVCHPNQLKKAREDILRLTAASPALMGEHGFTCLGTGAVFDLMDNRRMMPTNNFTATHFARASHLNAHAYHGRYAPKKHGCKGCHILCKKIGHLPQNPETDLALPEFETMSHFTALIGSRETGLVVEANDLCNRLGLDTISMASTLACRREITGEDYTRETLLELIHNTAHGTGDGHCLKFGSRAYAASMGRPETSMSVKGLELPAYDPRGAYGMALGYAVSTRGGCHLRAYPIAHEVLRKPVATDRFSFSGKARIIKLAEDLNAVVDALVACKFVFFAAGLEEYAKVFSAVTGISTTAQDLLKIGERIYYNERIINAMNGWDARADDLPQRFFLEKGSSGNQIHIPPLDRNEFLSTREKYYRIRGLSPNGNPTPKIAKELNLEWIDLSENTPKN